MFAMYVNDIYTYYTHNVINVQVWIGKGRQGVTKSVFPSHKPKTAFPNRDLVNFQSSPETDVWYACRNQQRVNHIPYERVWYLGICLKSQH